ncbi:MAG: hypothetical protein ACREK2_05790 [Gemmatimonadota bacterium]
MTIVSGQEGVVLSIARISIHGDEYVDVLIADAAAPDDLTARLSARLGPEAIAGDIGPGDRVKVEGFLHMITRLEKVE